MGSLKTTKEFATEIGKTPRQVRRMCETNKILSFKLGGTWCIVGFYEKGERNDHHASR